MFVTLMAGGLGTIPVVPCFQELLTRLEAREGKACLRKQLGGEERGGGGGVCGRGNSTSSFSWLGTLEAQGEFLCCLQLLVEGMLVCRQH